MHNRLSLGSFKCPILVCPKKTTNVNRNGVQLSPTSTSAAPAASSLHHGWWWSRMKGLQNRILECAVASSNDTRHRLLMMLGCISSLLPPSKWPLMHS